MAKTPRKRRIPKLAFTTSRNIGWHCSYRDPVKGSPRKKVFGMVSRGEAEVAYHAGSPITWGLSSPCRMGPLSNYPATTSIAGSSLLSLEPPPAAANRLGPASMPPGISGALPGILPGVGVSWERAVCSSSPTA